MPKSCERKKSEKKFLEAVIAVFFASDSSDIFRKCLPE
jgi:hypothetical protein